jgi:hypothetical protein
LSSKDLSPIILSKEGSKYAEIKYGKPVSIEWSLAEKKYEKAFNEELPKRAMRINDPTISQEDFKRFSAKYIEPSLEAKQMWQDHQKDLRERQKKRKSAPSGSSF